MSLRKTLTNEQLTLNTKFDNHFRLVNAAIEEARSRVNAGEGEVNPHIASDVMEDFAQGRCSVNEGEDAFLRDTPEDKICFPDEQEVK